MKKIHTYTSVIAVLMFLCFSANAQVRILTIGDSTMANYDEEKKSGEDEMRGWAQMLPTFVKENVRVDNAAKNGRSSKSFYYEFWENLRETLQPGDYVFIQFGHNDEKANGLDTDETDKKARGTAAWGQYQKYLSLYISDSRNKGAIPILITPVVRRLFDENNNITDKGLHNLSEIALDDSTMNYPLAMRTLARTLSVPLVDMTLLTEGLVKDYGSEKSKEIIYANSDNTHLKAMGGVLFAKLAVEELLRQNILADELIIPDELVIKTTTAKNADTVIPQGGEKIGITWNPTRTENTGLISSAENKEGLKYIVQQGKTLFTTPDNTWPAGDIDVNTSRYIELSISTPVGDMYIESVAFEFGAIGGKEMAFTALGSADTDFSDAHTLALMESLPEGETKVYESNTIIKVPEGKTFYIRIYPWYKTQSTDKYLYIKNLSVQATTIKL